MKNNRIGTLQWKNCTQELFIFPSVGVSVDFLCVNVVRAIFFHFRLKLNENKVVHWNGIKKRALILNSLLFLMLQFHMKKKYDCQRTSIDEGRNTQKKRLLIRIAHFFALDNNNSTRSSIITANEQNSFGCWQQTVSIIIVIAAFHTAFPFSNLNRPSNDTISHYWKRFSVIKKTRYPAIVFRSCIYAPYVYLNRWMWMCMCLCRLAEIYLLDKSTE